MAYGGATSLCDAILHDGNTNDSDAYITFVGTGPGGGQLKILIFILLLTHLILAIAYMCL